MELIKFIFFIAIIVTLLPIILGIYQFFAFIIQKKSKKRVLSYLNFILCSVLFFGILCGLIVMSYHCNTKLSNYIFVVIYTILFSIYSSKYYINKFYQERDAKIDSKSSAFKYGVTRFSSHIIFSYLPINIILYLFYIAALIVGQLFSMGIIQNSQFVEFCQYNEYGIIIMLAIKDFLDIVKSKSYKKRNRILDEVLDKDVIGNEDKQ